MRFASRTADLIHSPIGAAHALVPLRTNDRPLLDLSQAAPAFPPAPEVAARIAAVAHEPDGARYAPQPGLPALRDAFAQDLSDAYEAAIGSQDVLITAGCNQAFCLVASALASPGDSVVLATPFYFNHDMWLRVEGIEPRHWMPDEDLLPPVSTLADHVDETTRAIVIVSPGNPTGVTIPADRIRAIAAEARRLGVPLVLDETYRTYRGVDGPPHDLFGAPDWGDHVISLHSFSKDLAIPGYRIGAIVGSAPMLVEALKLLDCVAISAPRVAMEAVITGLTGSGTWRHDQVVRIGALQERFEAVMSGRPGGFELVSSGAYFGWVRHSFRDVPTQEVVRRLVLDHDVLVIPGTAFTPGDEHMLRFSFANLTEAELEELPRRLEEMHP
ncbi:MAG: aminotransferase [Actinomycetota bacterium]